jgi:hypothetical protein
MCVYTCLCECVCVHMHACAFLNLSSLKEVKLQDNHLSVCADFDKYDE